MPVHRIVLLTCLVFSEDLNGLVRRHIKTVVGNSPPKAVATLEAETNELISSGMDTFNGKLADIPGDKIVGRVVELWGFFWDKVLPYVEGVRDSLRRRTPFIDVPPGPSSPSNR